MSTRYYKETSCEHGLAWPDQHWIEDEALRHGGCWCQGSRRELEPPASLPDPVLMWVRGDLNVAGTVNVTKRHETKTG